MTLIRRFLIALAIAVLSGQAQAHPIVCDARQTLTDKLSSRYDESTAALGLASNGFVFELMISEEMNTWTLLYTTPDGVSCIVATGEDWIFSKHARKGEGS